MARAREAKSAPDAVDSWPELHAEIARLPDTHRVPILLCYFEGLTHEQAAGRLGWPIGTVKTRLARARERLRCRLKRHESNSAVTPLADSLRPWAPATVPRLLSDSTTRAAISFVTGSLCTEFVSSSVLSVVRGVLNTMLIHQLKTAAIGLIGVACLGLGVMALARQVPERAEATARMVRWPAPPTSRRDQESLNLLAQQL